MPVTVDRNESHWRLSLEGEFTLESSAEVKRALLDWLASGKDLQLDLERVEGINVTLMQLLWAAGREAAQTGVAIESAIPEAIAVAMRNAGFEQLPGAAAQE